MPGTPAAESSAARHAHHAAHPERPAQHAHAPAARPAPVPPRADANHRPVPHPIRVHCICGAEGMAPASYAGKQFVCRICGAAVLVPTLDGPQIPEHMDLQGWADEEARRRAANKADPELSHMRWRGADGWHDAYDDGAAPELGPYWRDALRALVPVRGLNDAAAMLALIAACTLGASALVKWSLSAGAAANMGGPSFSPLGSLLYAGAALGALAGIVLLVTLVQHAATDDTPHAMPTVRDVVVGVREWGWERPLGVLFALVLPGLPALLGRWLIPDDGLLVYEKSEVVIALAALGTALWPALIVMAALGAPRTLFNPIAALSTAAAAPFAYVWCAGVALALVLAVGLGANPAFRAVTGAPLQGADEWSWAMVGAVAIVAAPAALLAALLMRLVGLYHRHFSDRLQWAA